MPAESELEVKLVPDESAIEEVENRELELGGDGELSSSQENTRQGIISGGFKTALLATGLIGLLSSLKPIVGIIQAVLGILGRSLVPVIETVADFIRPVNQTLNDILSKIPGSLQEFLKETGKRGAEQAGIDIATEEERAQIPDDVPPGGAEFQTDEGETKRFITPEAAGEAINQRIVEGFVNILESVTGGDTGSPDQSGEADKIDAREKIEEPIKDKLGG